MIEVSNWLVHGNTKRFPVLEHLHDGESVFGRERSTPGPLEFLANLRGLDALVVGIDRRNQPRVTRPLDVVLPPQRMQARTGLADVSGQQSECDQTARALWRQIVPGKAKNCSQF